MKVSIITTCYNREQTIRATIESVLRQSYPNVEYIVIDGASSDGSLRIIEEYRDRIEVIVSEADGGIYEALNKGLQLSSGDVVGMLHSDDIFYSDDTISNIVAQISILGADMLYGNGLFVDSRGRVVRNWVSGEFDPSRLRYGWLPLHTTLFLRRRCLADLGLYDEGYRISADSDFLVRYLSNSNLIVAYYNNYIVKMRMGGASTDCHRLFEKWGEDLALYRSHGLNPLWALSCKVLSKIPQFISAKFIKNR